MLVAPEHSKKFHPPGNRKLNNLGIFQSLKLRTVMGKILSIVLKLNFTPNTLNCYGLITYLWLGRFLIATQHRHAAVLKFYLALPMAGWSDVMTFQRIV